MLLMALCPSLWSISFEIEGYRIKIPAQLVQPCEGPALQLVASELVFSEPKIASEKTTGPIPRGAHPHKDLWTPWPESLALLPKMNPPLQGALFRSVLPESVNLLNAEGQKAVLDQDYIFDKDWGCLLNKNDRLGVMKSKKITVSFDLRLQRLDLIQADSEGRLSVVKGIDSLVCPELPAAQEGHRAIAGVYIAPFYNQKGLDAGDVLTITQKEPSYGGPQESLRTFMQKLCNQEGRRVKIAFVGDGLTEGAAAGEYWNNEGKTWRELVFNTITHSYSALFEMIPGYKGGCDSSSILPFVDKILTRKPDLTFVLLGGLDGRGPQTPGKVSPKNFRDNMNQMISSLQNGGSAVVLLTPIPSFKANVTSDRIPAYTAILKELAQEKHLPLVDLTAVWESVAKTGRPPFALLYNWNDHPGIAGHAVLAKGVLAAMGLQNVNLPTSPNLNHSYSPKIIPWREQVKTLVAQQPEYYGGEWVFTEQPFPPAKEIVALPPSDLPIYGCYSWGGEYKKFRNEIKKVGWKSYRLGGPPDEEALRMAIEDGIEVMATIQIGTNLQEWKESGKRHAFNSDEAFIERFIQDLEKFILRFGPNGSLFKDHPQIPYHPVRHIEIWNEPNFDYMIKDRNDRQVVQIERDKLYGQLLMASSKYLREKAPEVKIVAFSAGGAAFDDKRFIGNVHQLYPDIGKYYDILSTHPYTNTPSPSDRIEKWGTYSVVKGWNCLQDILKQHGLKKAIWYTEVGWSIDHKDGGAFSWNPPSVLPHSAMMQASCVLRMYAHALRLGVQRVHIMSTCDADSFNSGFFNRSDAEWRPVAYATQNMIRLMPHPHLSEVIFEDHRSGIYAYRFRANVAEPQSNEIIMAWTAFASGEISLPLSDIQVDKMTNMLGGTMEYRYENDRLSFHGGPLPCFAVLKRK